MTPEQMAQAEELAAMILADLNGEADGLFNEAGLPERLQAIAASVQQLAEQTGLDPQRIQTRFAKMYEELLNP